MKAIQMIHLNWKPVEWEFHSFNKIYAVVRARQWVTKFAFLLLFFFRYRRRIMFVQIVEYNSDSEQIWLRIGNEPNRITLHRMNDANVEHFNQIMMNIDSSLEPIFQLDIEMLKMD